MALAEADDLHCRGQLEAGEVQQLLWQMLHAIKYLHDTGVWHRDIKTSNVLLTTEDGRRIVKVGGEQAWTCVCIHVHDGHAIGFVSGFQFLERSSGHSTCKVPAHIVSQIFMVHVCAHAHKMILVSVVESSHASRQVSVHAARSGKPARSWRRCSEGQDQAPLHAIRIDPASQPRSGSWSLMPM